MKKKKKDLPESYRKMMEELEKKGGIVERDINKYIYKDTRLLKDQDLTPKNIKKQIEENKEMQNLMDDAEKFDKEQKAIRKGEALKTPSDTSTIYNKKGNLTDLSGKPKFKKIKSLLGILPATAATALSMFAPESKASSIANTVSKVIDEGDPTSLIFPESLGEGEDKEMMRLNEEHKKIRSEKEIEPIIKNLGEKPSPDLEEMEDSLTYEDYLRKKKRQLGY